MGDECVQRVLRAFELDDAALAETSELNDRERTFCRLVRANSAPEDERRRVVREATGHLGVDEIYHATSVIALFNFYNTFVDLNGVDELSADGYRASGARLSTQGYAPPAAAAPLA